MSTGEDIRSSESDIRAAIRDLFAVSEMARREDMTLESDRTDLRTGQVILEVKRRILKGGAPNPKHIEQIDGYLDDARLKGRPERLGILTDGMHWALRPSSETGTAFKAAVVRTFTSSTLSLFKQLDYRNKLSKQIPPAAARLIYTKSGRPTAAVLEHSDALIDHKLFWIACRSIDEAHYLAAIINSDVLRDAVEPLMPKGQFGARDLNKHLWKLDIPEYDPADRTHAILAQLGSTAAGEASADLTDLRTQHAEKGRPLTWRVARRELCARLAASATGQKIETLVTQLNI